MASSKSIVLVTGGNTGVGYGIVKRLALEHPETHHILMGTRSLEKGSAAFKTMNSPSNVTPVPLDVTKDSSIDAVADKIKTQFGKLDILINNAGTAGLDLGEAEKDTFHAVGKTTREVYTHVFSVNVTSSAIMVEKMAPLLDLSSLPKVIFISSGLGSIQKVIDRTIERVPCPWYNSSKAALNYLTVWYAREYPDWKVNSVCPGLNATGLNHVGLTEETDPKNGAIRVSQLVLEGKDGVTATYSHKGGVHPW